MYTKRNNISAKIVLLLLKKGSIAKFKLPLTHKIIKRGKKMKRQEIKKSVGKKFQNEAILAGGSGGHSLRQIDHPKPVKHS